MSVVSSIKPPTRPASSAAGFQRVRHVAPKFRANGKEIEGPATCSQNILSENIKMPQQWEAPQNDQTRSRMTQKKLEMQRKKADMPHHSFDIDGDGHVSNTDLFLAKRFDQDKDGKLNAEELQTAKKALAEGYKDQFMFGLDRGNIIQTALVDYDIYGVDSAKKMNTKVRKNEKLSNIRVMQRDGKFLIGEDFTSLAPARATSALGIRTKSDLIQKRRQESISRLQSAYGDLQKPKNAAQFARPQSVQGNSRPSTVMNHTKPLAERLL